MAVCIRIAVPSDASAIAELENKYFSFPHSRQQIENEISNDCFALFAAVSGDELCGYIGLQYVIDEGYITNVVVDEIHRRKGIGDELVKTALNFGRQHNLSFISLEVRSRNKAAIDLYSRNNFIEEGIIKNYYSNPNDDALIMTNRCLK